MLLIFFLALSGMKGLNNAVKVHTIQVYRNVSSG